MEFVAEEERGLFLSSFALVNREARQLSLPYQFADVCITRSDTSWAFLRRLKQEAESPDTLEMAIGACVRCLTLAVDRDHGSDDGSGGFNQFEEEWEEYWQALIDDLAQAVENAMPNLDRVFWVDTGDLHVQPRLLPAVLKHAAPSSSRPGRMRELYFSGYKFLFNYVEDISPILSAIGPRLELRTLAVGFPSAYSMYGDPDGCTAYFSETILRLCAPTLEFLAWSGQFEDSWSTNDVDGAFRDRPIVFDKLRKFWSFLNEHDVFHSSILECVLAAPLLESFSPSAHLCSIMLAHGMAERFSLPQLRTFAVSCIWGEICGGQTEYIDKVLSLASRYGSRIKELFVYLHGDSPPTRPGVPHCSLDSLVSHYSSGTFCNLRFLCFSWVPDRNLKLLRTIGLHLSTLEELSFGFQPADDLTAREPNRYDDTLKMGCPPHQEIMAAISPLKKLVRLGVFGDEYVAGWSGSHWAWHRFFKEHVWFHQGRSPRTPKKDYFSLEEVHMPSEAIHGHKRPGDKTNDWMTRWVTGDVEDPCAAVVELAGRYAEALPILQEFMSGRVLVKIVEAE